MDNNDKMLEETNRRLENIKKTLAETEQMGEIKITELDKQTAKLENTYNNLLYINNSQNDANTKIKKMLNKCRCNIF